VIDNCLRTRCIPLSIFLLLSFAFLVSLGGIAQATAPPLREAGCLVNPSGIRDGIGLFCRAPVSGKTDHESPVCLLTESTGAAGYKF
jgi:hypothetical protein